MILPSAAILPEPNITDDERWSTFEGTKVLSLKPARLVVDYIGVAQNLKDALGEYSGGDRAHTSINQTQAVAVMREKYEIVRAIFIRILPAVAMNTAAALSPPRSQ